MSAIREIILAILADGRDRTTAEIADECGIDAQRASEHLSKLRRDGMVIRAATRQPGEPGAPTGRGAKPTATYTLSDEARPRPPRADAAALAAMRAADEDDAEACLDAAVATGGDECHQWTPTEAAIEESIKSADDWARAWGVDLPHWSADLDHLRAEAAEIVDRIAIRLFEDDRVGAWELAVALRERINAFAEHYQ